MSKYDATPVFHVKWSCGEQTFTDAALMGRFIAQGATVFRIAFNATLANPDTAAFEPYPSPTYAVPPEENVCFGDKVKNFVDSVYPTLA